VVGYESAEVVVDRATNQSRGIGFVRFASDGEAARALELLRGAEICGRALVVEPAQSEDGDRPRGRRTDQRRSMGGSGRGNERGGGRPGRGSRTRAEDEWWS